MMSNWKLPKWAVVIAAALLVLPQTVEWVVPGAGTRLAMAWLEGESSDLPFPLWGWLVGRAGQDYGALTAISVCAGLACVWLVAAIAGLVFGAAVRGAKAGGVKGEEGYYRLVRSAAVLLAGLGFVLTPGFLSAATRISPLMVALVPGLLAVSLVAWVLSSGAPAQAAGQTIVSRLKAGKGRLLLAAGLLAYSAYELTLARRVFLALAFPAMWVWLAVGVMPALVIAWCLRKRWLVGKRPLFGALGVWALAILVLGATSFTLGTLNRGRVANRIAAQIVATAVERGHVAIASDGALDGLFYFMLPAGMRTISLARERDPAYGRALSEWVKARGDDLAFAAELGPVALIDEWAKLDKAGLEATVMTASSYFPTREKWDAACDALKDMRTDEPLAGYLRHLLAVCGNGLGCQLIERGDLRGAWSVFKTIVYAIEPKNYGAYVNLQGMIRRGHAVAKSEADELASRRQQLERSFQRKDRMMRAAQSSGRLYADPKEMEKYERLQREARAKRELSPKAQAFVKTIAAAPKDPQSGKAAQEAIYNALREGLVGIEAIGGHLITIDLAIGDAENAEKDALSVLKADRHDPTANATLGSLAGMRGDYPRAERYLRRAIATGKASIAAKNDLAYVLCLLGRLDEAEALAREAVKGYDGRWSFHETLAAILIRKGRLDEGARELERAENLAQAAGLEKRKVASLKADRALLMKMKRAAK